MIPGRHPRLLAALALGLLLCSCATSRQLTLRSEKLLIQGDARRAYDTALDALEKDPRNEDARRALGAAGGALFDDTRRRFYAVLPVDTVAAGRLALDVERMSATLERCRVAPPADTAFARDRRSACEASADGLIRAADDSLAADRARPAYRLLQEAALFAPQRHGLDERLRRAFDRACDRVAVLPLDDQAGEPALARDVAARCAAALRYGVDHGKLEFTRLVEPSRVAQHMTAAQLGDLSRDEAVKLGREVGATVVLWGRLRDAGTDNDVTRYREPLWHRIVERGPDGEKHERWERVPFEAVVRERVYHVRWELRLLDTDDGLTLAERGEPRTVRTRTVWTSFRPEDDPENYSLVEPEQPRGGPGERADTGEDGERAARTERAQKAWSAAVGKWTVPKLLERSRSAGTSSRSSYRHEYRGEFEHADPDRPVFLGACPDADDLAWLALQDVESYFLSMIDEIDRR